MKKNFTALFLVLSLFSVNTYTWAGDIFKVTVSLKEPDIYRIENKNTFIKTKNCHQESQNEEATLKIEPTKGVGMGKITFRNGVSCDVEKMFS